MGVDITAFKQLKKLDCVFDADGYPIDPVTKELLEGDWQQFYLNPYFPGRADEIENKAVYAYTDAEHVFGRAYSAYNRLRDDLAKLAGYPLGQYEDHGNKRDSYCVACWHGEQGPFAEIINFSDCEGTIGTAISAKLAKDFADFQDKADAHEEEQFRKFYAAMRTAFEMASDDGAVRYS